MRSVNGFDVVKKQPVNDDIYAKIEEVFKLPKILVEILSNRVASTDELDKFLKPKMKHNMPDPATLPDIKDGLLLIESALKNKLKVCVFGDYDVDGSCSVGLLVKYLRLIGIECSFYIPDRIKEGYGPNVDAISKICAEGVRLIIMVDCGTLALEPIKVAKKNGVNVIVLDHHKSDSILPDCVLINPHRIDYIDSASSDLRHLCAAGLVFLFIVYLHSNFGKDINDKVDLFDFLPLTALATVCDVMPLVGFNRAIVSTGLDIINKQIKEDPKKCRLHYLIPQDKIDDVVSAYHFGYIFGPMINAGGRIGRSDLGSRFLLSTNVAEIKELSQTLAMLNTERIEIEQNILNSIKAKNIDERVIRDGFIFEYDISWHEGVIGIIASRVKDAYHRPAIIGSWSGDIIKCSARSCLDIDIGDVILRALEKGLLIKGGGHKMAGGFSLYKDKVDEFVEFLQNDITSRSHKSYEKKRIQYDAELDGSLIDTDLCDSISKLEPFGMGNSRPVLLIRNLTVILTKIIKDRHISVLLKASNGLSYWAMIFNCMDQEIAMFVLSSQFKDIDILGTMEKSTYKNVTSVKIIIQDIVKK